MDPALQRRSRVLFRLKAREKVRIQKAAARSGLTVSAYVRGKMLVDGPKPRVSREVRDQLRDLGVRTNAFARQANLEGQVPSEAQLDALLAELRQMLRRLDLDLSNSTGVQIDPP